MNVSVVIPCFNAETVIDQQLEALARQTATPYEVIVADNGSTDNSVAVVEQYRDRLPRLKVIDASRVRGASHARNAGAKVATGDYLAFCDADDVVAQGWLEALGQAFTRCGFLACRADSEMLNPGAVNTPQSEGLQNFRTPFYPFAGGCVLAIRKDIHASVGGFDEAILHLEDADYCIRVQMAGHALTYVPEAVVHYRHGTGTEQSFIEARQATYRKAYNWGYGLATLYLRYRDQGMQLHGLAPRLALIPLWGVRFLGTGLRSHHSLWRLGWHMGVVDRLLSSAEVPSPPVSTPLATLAARS